MIEVPEGVELVQVLFVESKTPAVIFGLKTDRSVVNCDVNASGSLVQVLLQFARDVDQGGTLSRFMVAIRHFVKFPHRVGKCPLWSTSRSVDGRRNDRCSSRHRKALPKANVNKRRRTRAFI